MNSMITIGFACLVSFLAAISNARAFHRVSDDDSDPWKPMDLPKLDTKEKDASFWRKQGLIILDEKLSRKINTNKAKNIIFFLGDGLSVPTISAARIYQGQRKNKTGEEEKLFFETFPYTGLSKTYCTDKQVPDSASTATAYMCGVKANYRTIGVSAAVEVADCDAAKISENRPESIVKWAQDARMATGVITNTRVTHASPAGSYAHVPLRDMESDADVVSHKLDPKSCDFDIASQLIYDEPGRNIKVIMGGGRSKFLPTTNTTYGTGVRLDMKNLIDEWKQDKQIRRLNHVYVSNVDEFRNVDPTRVEFLLGLFADSHMSYHLENAINEPALWEMTEMAIKILEKNAYGFYLFVEGGKIDMAHHDAKAHIALDETVEFSKAIERAYQMTDEKETLIVVTADHAHTLAMSGYPARGNDILGLYGKSMDNLPYSTLSYANGPGYRPEKPTGQRYNLENDNTTDANYTYPALVPKLHETHGGDDVAVYASGPWSHLFSGNYEQNYLPIAEAYAAQIGPSNSRLQPPNAAATLFQPSFITFISITIATLPISNLFVKVPFPFFSFLITESYSLLFVI